MNQQVVLEAPLHFLRRYVVMSEPQAVALWTVHTHALDSCESEPLSRDHFGGEAKRKV